MDKNVSVDEFCEKALKLPISSPQRKFMVFFERYSRMCEDCQAKVRYRMMGRIRGSGPIECNHDTEL